MKHAWSLLSVAILLFTAASLLADNGQHDVSKQNGAAMDLSPKHLPGVTPEREAAAMTFVQQHHPELAALLVYLKDNRSSEYQKAVRDLFRISERLATTQERDFERYQLELDLWKSQSRSQLLAARLKMGDNPALREQLRASLGEQVDLQRAILQRDRDRLADRLEKLDEQIERLGSDRQQQIEKQLLWLTQDLKSGSNKDNTSTLKTVTGKGVGTTTKSPGAGSPK